jgi:hypothetical protein
MPGYRRIYMRIPGAT